MSTTYTYDLDGDVVTETAHHGCVSGQTCPDGTTRKWYDGADRLLEVALPLDPRTFVPGDSYDGGAWFTRYWYDLSVGGTVSVTGSAPFQAYGNLYKTQVGSSNGWLDKAGTQFDALDRATAKYAWSTAWEDTPAALETTTLAYDTGAPGLLTGKTNPAQESVAYTYDSHGRKVLESYSGDGGRTPAESYVYDANGRTASITSAQLGTQQYGYDADGRLTTSVEPSGGGITSPATITYSYYANGRRSAVSVASSGLNQANVLQYSYRPDGIQQTLTSNAFASGTWNKSYTDAGRLTAVTGIDNQHLTYDASGQLQNDAIGNGSMTLTHDPEGSPNSQYTTNLAGGVVSSTTISNTFNVRGELIQTALSPDPNGAPQPYTTRTFTSGGCTWRIVMPQDGSSPPDPPQQDWRSCATISNGTMGGVVYNGTTYPSGTTTRFTYDVAGRVTRDVKNVSTFSGGDPTGSGLKQGGSVAPLALTTVTTTDTVYDAENHTLSRRWTSVRTRTNPDQGTSSSTTTTSTGSPETLGWGPNEHPVVVNAGTGAAGLTLHWDGDVILFITDASGTAVDFKAGLDGEVVPHDTTWTGLTAYDRDVAGLIIGTTDSRGSSALNPLEPNDGSGIIGGSATSPSAYAQYVRPDGFSIMGIQVNGVRVYNPTLQSWTTPDAFEGDIHDPVSQQKYMWNRGNAIDYQDPRGYNPFSDAGMAALNWFILDDVRTASDKKKSAGERIVAGALAAASLVPEGKIPGKVVGSIIKGFTKHGLERGIERQGGAASEKAILDAARNPVAKHEKVDAQGARLLNMSAKTHNSL